MKTLCITLMVSMVLSQFAIPIGSAFADGEIHLLEVTSGNRTDLIKSTPLADLNISRGAGDPGAATKFFAAVNSEGAQIASLGIQIIDRIPIGGGNYSPPSHIDLIHISGLSFSDNPDSIAAMKQLLVKMLLTYGGNRLTNMDVAEDVRWRDRASPALEAKLKAQSLNVTDYLADILLEVGFVDGLHPIVPTEAFQYYGAAFKVVRPTLTDHLVDRVVSPVVDRFLSFFPNPIEGIVEIFDDLMPVRSNTAKYASDVKEGSHIYRARQRRMKASAEGSATVVPAMPEHPLVKKWRRHAPRREYRAPRIKYL